MLLGLVTAAGCTQKPTTTIPYSQDFSVALGSEWFSMGGGWQVVDGRLYNDGAHNVPLWLDAALPAEVRISFTAESKSEAVDMKVELFGDGRNHESGYIIILAGWNNSRSIIARLAEHGERHNPPRTPATTESLRRELAADPRAARVQYADRREITQRSAQMAPNTVYRLRVERQDHELKFFVNDELHLEYFDPSPLSGEGHDRFAFNNWASQVYFDDLKIERL